MTTKKRNQTTGTNDTEPKEKVKEVVVTGDKKTSELLESLVGHLERKRKEEEASEHPLVREVRGLVGPADKKAIKFLESALAYVRQNKIEEDQVKEDDRLVQSFKGLVKSGNKKLAKFLEDVLKSHSASAYRDLYSDRKGVDQGCSFGTYLLEVEWSWDNAHTELLTIGLEKCNTHGIGLDEILNAPSELEFFLEMLDDRMRNIRTAGGTAKKVRLYRIVGGASDCEFFGGWPHRLKDNDEIDLHLILKPICDFDGCGNPVPCKFGF